MKKIIKKAFVIFLSLISILYTEVYANMTLEAVEESHKFYTKHKFFIDLTQSISTILELAFCIFLIIIPVIIIYKNIKLRNKPNDRDKYIIKTLKLVELLLAFNVFISYYLNTSAILQDSASKLGCNIFIILISLINIGIILFKLLKNFKK